MENGETIVLSFSDNASPNKEEKRILMELRSRDETYSSDKVLGRDDDRHPPLLSTNGGDDGGGPTLNDSGANEVGRSRFSPCPPTSPKTTSHSNIFRDDVPSAAAVPETNARGGGSAVTVTTLQPFDISHTRTPEVGMAAALGFPFTAAQWKELERQAMIYKYMVASLPVPPDLLMPVTSRKFSDPTATLGSGSLYSLRCPNRDPEPGRCKRTDGKKWRCSRDVAPHQKYCERHMHRGRPRSRKPVEVHPSVDTNNNKKTRLNQSPLQTNATAFSNPTGQANGSFSSSFRETIGQPKDPVVIGGARATAENISKSLYKEPSRVLGWTMDGEMVAGNGVEQQWLHLMDTKRGLPTVWHSIYSINASNLHHGHVEEPPNLFTYADLPREDMHSRNNDCHLFLNSDLISPRQPQMDDYPISRGFIDAWSSGNLETINNETSISSSQGNLPPSSLNLSIAMAAGNVIDEEMGPPDAAHPPAVDSDLQEPKDSPAPWLPFSSGGPLAEVLQPSYLVSGSNPASPYATNADSVSPPPTAVSSPSGVLQRALLSQSDGSVCNSPTIALSAAPQEAVAFQWLR